MSIKDIKEKLKKAKATTWIAFWGLIGVFGGIIQVQRQISNQDKQIQIQQSQFNKQLCNTRFSSAIELLGSQSESTRIGGAYSLYFLANEYDEYLNPICEILCAHIRYNLLKNIDEHIEFDYSRKKISQEIQAFVDLLFLREDQNKEVIFDVCKKNLRDVVIDGINLSHTTLSNVDFSESFLTHDNFKDAKLNNVNFLSRQHLKSSSFLDVDFENAELCDVNFGGTLLYGGKFINAKFSNVNFSDATLQGIEIVPEEKVNFENATLSNVRFERAKLIGNKFTNAILINVDFTDAILEGEIDFTGTVLDGYSYAEITRPGRSLELTKTKE